MHFTLRPLAAIAFAAAAFGAAAQPVACEQPRNVVQLSASASVQAQQDLLVLTLAAIREGDDAAAVQSQLQQALDAALAEVRRSAAPGQMDVRTGDFSIQPRYGKDGRITTWQGRAELVLSGRDFARITAAGGRARGLAVSQVGFELSREARERVEGQAQAQAVEAFKARAGELARSFGFAGYGLREVNVSSHEASPGPRPRMMMMQAKGAAMEADAAVPVEAGKAQVVVNVSGSVQMR